jgi:hypothetical protein
MPLQLLHHQQNYYVSIFQRIIFFGAHFPSVKPSGFFTDENADRKKITDERFTDKHFTSMNQLVKYAPIEW